MGYRGQSLETGQAALELRDGRGGATGKMWDLPGEVQRARCWALLFPGSQQTDDQGQEESKTAARFSTKGTRRMGVPFTH